MTTPTPELVTAEQAAALLEFYRLFKRVIPQDKAEEDASAALRTIIALHEALAAEIASHAETRALLQVSEAGRDPLAELWRKEKARADTAEARVAVRVKPLVWVRHPNAEIWRCDTMIGAYQVFGMGQSPTWSFDSATDAKDVAAKRAVTHEAAQAAAQADYEARITAALETGAGDE